MVPRGTEGPKNLSFYRPTLVFLVASVINVNDIKHPKTTIMVQSKRTSKDERNFSVVRTFKTQVFCFKYF